MFTVVFSLLALMAVTLTTIYVSNRIALRRENEETLRTYVERYVLGDKPPEDDGEKPEDRGQDMPGDPPGAEYFRDDKPGTDPRFRLSTFYSVAYSDGGEVLAVDNGKENFHSEEEILEKAAQILSSGKESGRSGEMTYIVEKRDGYTLVAMLDGTISERDQALLIRQMLIIGAIALALLFVVSVFIARRIVRPLEENDARQKRFVSDAGHELKTPIAVISANSELLRRQSGGSEWLDNIDYENERMSDLVKQLLLLSKAERGETPKQSLDLSKLVAGETLPFESLAFEKGKRVEQQIEDGLRVEGDANQLRQLVSILLDNAVEHGTGEVVALSLRRERHSALICVSNAAEHMSEEQLSHLFDRFYRADEARGEEGSHYGLGLSIAKAVAESHGGTIAAEYRDGEAIFSVSLPLEKN